MRRCWRRWRPLRSRSASRAAASASSPARPRKISRRTSPRRLRAGGRLPRNPERRSINDSKGRESDQMANFGMVGLDWQERVNWDRLRKYRLDSARKRMKAHGLGAMLCMYDENVRYLTGTLTPGWNRLKPGLRYAMLCGDGAPILFEQGDLGFQIERHSPWIPKENVRHSFAWIKGAAGPASTQQVNKFTKAVLQAMKDNGVAGQKLGVDFIDINMISIFKENNINWTDGMSAMMDARAVKSADEQECFRIVGAIGDATHWECMKFLRPGITENQVTARLRTES